MNLEEWKKRPFRMWVLAALLRILTWIGVKADLLVIVREGLVPLKTKTWTNAYSFAFLGAEDIEALISLDAETPRDQLEQWFRDGKLCFGARDGTRLIAKMWCDLEEFYHPNVPRKLASDEAYLYLAYVHPDYRGKDLAPQMRAAGYSSLREIGRTKFYSYSRYFNTAARRFKAKLGAREDGLRIVFQLFGRWSTSLTFRWRVRPTALK